MGSLEATFYANRPCKYHRSGSIKQVFSIGNAALLTALATMHEWQHTLYRTSVSTALRNPTFFRTANQTTGNLKQLRHQSNIALTVQVAQSQESLLHRWECRSAAIMTNKPPIGHLGQHRIVNAHESESQSMVEPGATATGLERTLKYS